MRWHSSLYKKAANLRNGPFYPTAIGLFIPAPGWPFLPDPNNGDLDDSNYQGFSKVQIEINRYSYELNLQPAPEGNPFMEILKLVWEEYEAVLREKDLVLPWFKVLGWA